MLLMVSGDGPADCPASYVAKSCFFFGDGTSVGAAEPLPTNAVWQQAPDLYRRRPDRRFMLKERPFDKAI